MEKQSGLTLIKNSEFDYFVLISILNAFEINYQRIKAHTNSAQWKSDSKTWHTHALLTKMDTYDYVKNASYL